MRYRSLYSNVGCGDDDGSTNTGKDLRTNEDGGSSFSGREVHKRDTTVMSDIESEIRRADLHNSDTTSNNLQDLVSMSDSLDYTNDDC